jgi:Zn-dependent protease
MKNKSKPALTFQYQDMAVSLYGNNWNGKEKLYVSNKLVSQRRNFRTKGAHTFEWQGSTWQFNFKIDLETGMCQCKLDENGEEVWQQSIPYQLHSKVENKLLNFNKAMAEAEANEQKQIETESSTNVPTPTEPPKKQGRTFTFVLVAMKLLKSAKVIQVGLVGASVASYSFLFDWRFAVIIVMALMFHEFGHMQAMKKMGMRVKGMYLIPFIGGAAVTSDQFKTRWENVFVSMMGPVYGLIMTVVFFVVYLQTNHSLAAGLAAFSALLNLINLLPIIPLDGGHVVKSIAYSIHSKIGTAVLWLGVLLSIFITWNLGLSLFAFLTIIGALDLLFGSSTKQERHIVKLTNTGVLLSTVWYLGTIVAFIAMILVMTEMGMAGSQLVSDILNS